ncbi:MAG: winged helix-turn-helix transcriptional regulator [Halodesulfurarchaeum sp.]|nr:winged helix-turn-helix transcriptional regulator [Halodesulfurarchaeum sp.]
MTIDEEKRTTLRKFAAVGAGSPLLGLAEGEERESDARDAIAGYVETTPGAHFSKIRDDLTLATGETQYHLRRLTSNDELEVCRDGDYKRYFSAGQFSRFEQRALGYLRRSTPRAMLLALLEEPTLTGASLAENVGVSPATISNYAGEMAEAGLLDRQDGYHVSNPETVISLLLRYAPSFDGETKTFARKAATLFTYDP